MGFKDLSTMDKLHCIGRAAVRTLQVVLGLTIIGLYASDLKLIHGSDVRYIYAVVVGTISTLSALIMCIPAIKSFLFFAWDFLVFILNVALFGAMGRYFINPSTVERQHDDKMRHAVWVVCIAMVLWFSTAVAGGIQFWIARRGLGKQKHIGQQDFSMA